MDTRSQHLLVDAVLDTTLTNEHVEIIKSIVEKNLTVVDRVEYKFNPQGETIVFVLSESHFSLHTYPEHNYITFDIYVCNMETNLEKLLNEIKTSIPISKMDSQILYRGKIAMEEDASKLKLIYLLTILVAMGSILYEFLLAQSLSTTMGNTALRYNITIGIYIASMGFGAMFYKKLIGEKLFEEFIKVEVLLSIVGGVAPVLVLVADYAANSFSTSTGLPFYGNMVQMPLFLFNHFLIVLIGFMSGLELPLLIDMAKKYQLQKGHRILALDYLGTLIGAIAFPLIILPKFHVFTIGYLVSFINVFASLIVCYKLNINKNSWKLGLFLMMIVWLLLIFNSTAINQFIVNHFYFGGRL